MPTPTTYATLQTEIVAMMHRSDVDAVRAIAMTEAKINRTLEDPSMEVRVTADAAEYMAVPSDYLMLRRIQVNVSPPRFLDLYSPAYAASISTPSGIPKFYAIEDNELRLIPAPDSSYSIEITYFMYVPALSATNTTNWLLTKHPDIYLYGGLFEASVELRDIDGAQGYKSLWTDAMSELVRLGKRQRWAGNPMAMRRG